MSVGLEIGTHQLRSLRQDGDRLLAQRCRSVYSVLPDAEHCRRRLDELGIPYAVCDQHLLVWGDAAENLAELMPIRTVPLLPEGTLPHHDPPARQLLAALIGALLGEPVRPNEVCCLTHPGHTGRSRAEFRDTVHFLTRLIRLQGYTPLVISPGLALVLAELVSNCFTGIGMTFGVSTCEVSLAHHGVEIAQCTAPYRFAANWCGGGEWGMRYSEPRTPNSELRDVLYYVAQELSAVPAVRTVPQPLSLVIAGDTARTAGFDDLLQQAFCTAPFPVQIGDVRLTVAEYTVARGCLINAELEARTQSARRSAA